MYVEWKFIKHILCEESSQFNLQLLREILQVFKKNLILA